jgi:hypothetical protein
MDEQRRIIPIAAIMAGIAIAGLIAGMALIALRPPDFHSFSDAVGYRLQQRNIPYEKIFIDQRWPDTVNYQRYGAHVTVRVAGSSDVVGRLECQEERRNCRLWVRAFGIEREPLPELTRDHAPEWLRWIEERLPWLQ